MEIYFFLLLFVLRIDADNSINDLDRIVVIVRHGDRAPLRPYPFDQSKSIDLWPAGYGHLTKEGKVRMYRTGQYLRRRYSRYFMSRYISPRDVYFRSSSVERCLESSQLIAAGLSPPIDRWIWKSDLGELWQPVPIYTVPRIKDGLLNPASKCDRADNLFDRILNSQVVKNYMFFYKDFLHNISSFVGEDLDDHRKIRNLFDNLLSIKHHGYRMPRWINQNIYKQLKIIFDMSFKFDYTGLIEPDLKLLRAGLLMNEIFKNLDMVKNPNQSKLSIYVTHDSQLFHLHDALGLDIDKLSVKFGSMLIFEYNQRNNSVRLFSINNAKPLESINAEELTIPTCQRNNTRPLPLPYLLDRFQNIFIDNFDEWTKICSSNSLLQSRHTEL